MTRKEKSILREAIKAVANHNRNAWWELKRQIYEGGYQSYYPAQGDFDFPAQQVIRKLPDETKNALLAEWRQVKPLRTDYGNEEILHAYARLIVEEIVERARIAAYRTENW